MKILPQARPDTFDGPILLERSPIVTAARAVISGILLTALCLSLLWYEKRFVCKQRLKLETKKILEDLRNAQIHALQTGQVHRISFENLAMMHQYKIDAFLITPLDNQTYGVPAFCDARNWKPLVDIRSGALPQSLTAVLYAPLTIYIRSDGVFTDRWSPADDGKPLFAVPVSFVFGTASAALTFANDAVDLRFDS